MKKQSKAKFTLHGKPFDPLERGPGPTLRKMMGILQKLPDGKILDSSELAAAAGASYSSIWCYLRKPEIAAYRLEVNSRRIYWGNRKTVARGRKELAKRENY